MKFDHLKAGSRLREFLESDGGSKLEPHVALSLLGSLLKRVATELSNSDVSIDVYTAHRTEALRLFGEVHTLMREVYATPLPVHPEPPVTRIPDGPDRVPAAATNAAPGGVGQPPLATVS